MVFYIKRAYGRRKSVDRNHVHENWAEKDEYKYFVQEKYCKKSKAMCAIRVANVETATAWVSVLHDIVGADH